MDTKNPFQQNVRVKEETERGDVAKSLQQLISTHFISKRFKDIMGATRLTKKEVFYLSIMEIQRITAKILSVTDSDVEADGLSQEEKTELQELNALRKRFYKNPNALAYAVFDSFEYMFGLGLQSLDGASRMEGVTISTGATERVLNPNEMGFFDKMRRRLTGKVLYPE